MPTPTEMIPTSELIARRAVALQKRPEQIALLRSQVYRHRVEAARRFEEEYKKNIRDFNFKKGRLVLMRNTAIEKSLNRKMRPRYLGPLVVIARNKGGAYIVAELDGAVHDRPIAAFRLIPYLARTDPIQFSVDDLDLSADELKRIEEDDESADDEGLVDLE